MEVCYLCGQSVRVAIAMCVWCPPSSYRSVSITCAESYGPSEIAMNTTCNSLTRLDS